MVVFLIHRSRAKAGALSVGHTLLLHPKLGKVVNRDTQIQSLKIREPKYVSYDAQLCPVIAKGQRAPNAQLTHQIVDRHHEELKSSSPDSQTLKNPV